MTWFCQSGQFFEWFGGSLFYWNYSKKNIQGFKVSVKKRGGQNLPKTALNGTEKQYRESWNAKKSHKIKLFGFKF